MKIIVACEFSGIVRDAFRANSTFMCYNDCMNIKQIAGFPAYRLSDTGVLESCWTWGPYYPGMQCEPQWKIVPLRFNLDGYIPINLCDVGGKRRRTHLHRLLAETFISPPPFPRACVRHIDGNARNNSINNLAWGTYLENENDKKAHGTHRSRITAAKLTNDDMEIIRKMREAGESHEKIAQVVGVTRPTISRFLSGKTWRSE